jgi:hypothetical protein
MSAGTPMEMLFLAAGGIVTLGLIVFFVILLKRAKDESGD